jgi:hypothetical protein
MSVSIEDFKKAVEEAIKSIDGKAEMISPLPRPTVTLATSDAEILSGSDIMGVLHNPIYAGVTPFPSIISDEKWIATAAGLIKEEGEVLFLVNLLEMLRESYKQLHVVTKLNADVAL